MGKAVAASTIVLVIAASLIVVLKSQKGDHRSTSPSSAQSSLPTSLSNPSGASSDVQIDSGAQADLVASKDVAGVDVVEAQDLADNVALDPNQ